MLPKAIDYFHHNSEAIVYQMLWKSIIALHTFRLRKCSLGVPHRTIGASRKRKMLGLYFMMNKGRLRCDWVDE
ncbi:hypothetical protein EJB05_14162, partial [Eragrostis curvula]